MRLVDGGSLLIQDARQTDAGRYQCIARNAAGTRESAVATLKIHSEFLSTHECFPEFPLQLFVGDLSYAIHI